MRAWLGGGFLRVLFMAAFRFRQLSKHHHCTGSPGLPTTLGVLSLRGVTVPLDLSQGSTKSQMGLPPAFLAQATHAHHVTALLVIRVGVEQVVGHVFQNGFDSGARTIVENLARPSRTIIDLNVFMCRQCPLEIVSERRC